MSDFRYEGGSDGLVRFRFNREAVDSLRLTGPLSVPSAFAAGYARAHQEAQAAVWLAEWVGAMVRWPGESCAGPTALKVTELAGYLTGTPWDGEWLEGLPGDPRRIGLACLMPDEADPRGKGQHNGPTGRFRITVEFTPGGGP